MKTKTEEEEEMGLMNWFWFLELFGFGFGFGFVSLDVVFDMLDEYIETLRECKYLPENDLKKLCQIVRCCVWRGRGLD